MAASQLRAAGKGETVWCRIPRGAFRKRRLNHNQFNPISNPSTHYFKQQVRRGKYATETCDAWKDNTDQVTNWGSHTCSLTLHVQWESFLFCSKEFFKLSHKAFGILHFQ